jgi:hypothetical protein
MPSLPLRTLVAFLSGNKFETALHPVRIRAVETKSRAIFLENIGFEFVGDR